MVLCGSIATTSPQTLWYFDHNSHLRSLTKWAKTRIRHWGRKLNNHWHSERIIYCITHIKKTRSKEYTLLFQLAIHQSPAWLQKKIMTRSQEVVCLPLTQRHLRLSQISPVVFVPTIYWGRQTYRQSEVWRQYTD